MNEYQPTPPPDDDPPERAGSSEEQENEGQGSPGCGLMGCMGGALFGGILMIVLSVADAFVVSGGGSTYTNIVENVLTFSIVCGVLLGIVGAMTAYMRREKDVEQPEDDDIV